MKEIIKEINRKNKPQEFWSRNFTNFFAPFISVIFIKLKISPNLITISMLPTTFICLYFSIFIFDKNLNLFLISLIGVIINIIDCVDGIVARYSQKVSSYGKYLDRICHYAVNPSLFLAYGIYSIQIQQLLTGYIFIIITILDLFDMASKDTLSTLNLSKKDFSYSHPKKLTASLNSIRDAVVRMFFLPLTCFPHTILIFFPLFIYFKNLLFVYALLYLILLILKIYIRQKNIKKKYDGK